MCVCGEDPHLSPAKMFLGVPKRNICVMDKCQRAAQPHINSREIYSFFFWRVGIRTNQIKTFKIQLEGAFLVKTHQSLFQYLL